MKAIMMTVASLLILGASGGLGLCGAARLKERVMLLAGAGAGVDSLMRDIDYLASPLPQALSKAALCAGTASALFEGAASRLQAGDGLTGSEAWLAAVEEVPAAKELTPLLAQVAAGLGETDAACQLRQLGACRQELARGQREAEENYARFGKIWRSLGWCGGAVIVLLLL